MFGEADPGDAADAGNAQPRSLRRWGSGVGVDSALSMGALLVLGGTRVVYGAIVSHATDRETFGLIGLLIALTMLGSFVLPAGLSSAISRFIPFSRGRGDQPGSRGLARLLFRTAWLAALVLGAAAFAIASIGLHRPFGQSVEVALLMVAYAMYTSYKAGLYGFARVGLYLRLEILSGGIVLGLTLIIAAAGSTLYLTPFIVGYATFAGIAAYRLRADLVGVATGPDRRLGRELVGFVILACLGTVASAGFLQGTQFLAATFAPADELASFAAAVTLVTPIQFLPRALALAMFPSMSAAHGAGDTEGVRRQADISTRALLALLTPLFVAGIVLAPEILAVFGGERYVTGAFVLQLLLAGAFLSVIQVGSVNALSSAGGWLLRIPVAWAVTGALVGLAFVIVTGPALGSPGVAGAYVLGTAVTAAGPIAAVWSRQRMAWGGVVARAILCVVMSIFIALWLPAPGDPVAAIALHALVAMGAVVLTSAVLARDIRAVIATARGLA